MKNTGGMKLDLSVLFVEDETVAREKISGMIGREVSNLYLAENGKRGLEMFRENMPDVIITDIKMPVMDGLEMAREIRAVNSEVPIIVITAHGESEFLMTAIDIGIDSYLMKPLDVSKLGAKLKAIAAHIHIAKELRHKNRLLEEYKKAVDQSNLVCKTAISGEIIYANDEFCMVSGYSRNELIGKPFDFVLHPSNPENTITGMQNTIRSKNIWKGIMEHKKKNGDSYFVDLAVVPLLDPDDNILKFIYIGHNVSELVDFTRWLKQLSNTDSLTQIYNRMAFNDLLETEIVRAKRYNTGLALIILDIDHFKNINDTYGHLAGDEVLKTMAALITKSIRTIDIFARWGGEEFVILTPETGIRAAADLAERLRTKIEEHNFGEAGKITSSFGVVSLKGNDLSDSFIKRADDTLYVAKKNGRNRVETDTA